MSIRLIAGLGNDDDKYHLTFHNVGFWAIEALALRLQMNKSTAHEEYLVYRSPATDLLLITPHSYMNTGGPNIAAALRRFNVAPEEALIVLDDFSLPWGKLRFRMRGSSGGHNGLASVIGSLGSESFPRLRLGIGPVPEGVDPKDYVLKRQPSKRLAELGGKAADALELALADGLEKAMNRYNPMEP